MTDLIARFDRGPREEIRASLVNRDGQTYLELRVYDKPVGSEQEPFASPEGITVPLRLFDKLCRAIQAVEVALRRRNLLPREVPPAVTQMVGGEAVVVRAPAPTAPVRTDAQQPGRTELRLRLDCTVEYAVRGRPRQGREPERRHGRTKDISRTGVQVLLPERIPVLTLLHVTMRLPVGVVSLPCEVVWVQHAAAPDLAREGCRHGLRFTEVGPEERHLLDRLMGQAARQASIPPA